MAQTYNTQLNNVLAKFTSMLHVSVTPVWLREALLSHPDYPSLFSISESLKKLKVETLATKVEAEKLNELNVPFITYMKGLPTGKDFVLVTDYTAETVRYIYAGNKVISITRDEFLNKWEQVVLLAEAGPSSGQPDYEAECRKEKISQRRSYAIAAGWLAVLGILAGAIITEATGLLMPFVLLLFTKLVGVGIAVLLLWYETDKTNPFVKSICTAGVKTNCDAVLNSKASRFMGISWSEAGFFYFMASLLFLLFPGLPLGVKLPWIALAATIVAPYVIFSLYYQYKVVKQWCPLCLATQAIITIEFIIAALCYFNEAFVLSFSFSLVVTALIAVLVPILGWFVLKPLLAHTKNADHYEYAYKRILYNPDYFRLLLDKQPEVPGGWQHLGITIGNPDAENTIIKICNPYCGPCTKSHPVLNSLIESNANFRLKIVFLVAREQYLPAQHLMAIAKESSEMELRKALDDWYLAPKKDYDEFQIKYPYTDGFEKHLIDIEEMNDWCQKSEINSTPTLFFNGKKIPDIYQSKDLIKLI